MRILFLIGAEQSHLGVAVSTREYASHSLEDLETILATSIQNFTKGDSRFQSRILFHHDMPMSGYSFITDIKVLHDSILPLIINAVHHTKEGIVLITTALNTDKKELVVDVRDTGVGIHSDNHRRIFQPYEKVDENAAGAGLGLTLACKFATLQRGTVSLVSSLPGLGSHFRVSFEDIKSTCRDSTSPPCTPKFHNLPLTYYIDASELENKLLQDFMASVFGTDNVVWSEDIHNSSIVLSLRNPAALSPLSTDQVAICLDPCESKSSLPPPTNIFHVDEPITMGSVHSALQKANQYMAQLHSSSPTTLTPQLPHHAPVSTEHAITRDRAPTSNTDSFVVSTEPSRDTLQFNPAIKATLDAPTPLHSVLIVDDNMVNMRILQMYCKRRKLNYFSARDGQEAVRIFEEQQSLKKTSHGQGIQLILMDLQMPVCDGFSATTQIRQLEKDHGWTKSTLFIITGQDSLSDRETAKGIGAQDYFVKPVGLKILDESVCQYFPEFAVT